LSDDVLAWLSDWSKVRVLCISVLAMPLPSRRLLLH